MRYFLNKLLSLLLLVPLSFLAINLNVKDYGAKGDGRSDDTYAFQKAVDALSRNGGGSLKVPAGNYPISFLKFFGKAYSNITISGNNANILQLIKGQRKSVLNNQFQTYAERYAADGCFVFDAQVSNQITDINSIKNIKISGINFISDVEKYGFDELLHQISAHGVSNFIVENCSFTGFLGDGIAVNDGSDHKIYRSAYNKNIVIKNCRFDGVNKENRQGISIYYAEGFSIENCHFKNITRPDMPGAIDIEPNLDNQVSRNGEIKNCTFQNIGGIAAIVIHQNKLLEKKRGVSTDYTIENCKFSNMSAPISVIGSDDFLNYIGEDYNVEMSNCIINNTESVADIRNAYAVLFSDNIYRNITSKVKNVVPMGGAAFITFKNCVFDTVQNNNGLAFGSKTSKINFVGNTFSNFNINGITINDPNGIGTIKNNSFRSSAEPGAFPMVTCYGANAENLKNAIVADNTSTGNFRSQNTLYFFVLNQRIDDISGLNPATILFGTQRERIGKMKTLNEGQGTFETRRNATDTAVKEYFYPDSKPYYYYRFAISAHEWSGWSKNK